MHSTQAILNDYITIQVTKTWRDILFEFDSPSQAQPITVTEHTWGEHSQNYIRIKKRWYFLKSESTYNIDSDLRFQHIFHIDKKIFTTHSTYTNDEAQSPVTILPSSQVHLYKNSKVCNHLDFHSDNRVSHFIAQNSAVVGVVYLPDEHNPTKKYPIAKVSPSANLQDIAPSLIAFYICKDYGQRNNNGNIN
jgi:hypothetical protein